MPTLSMGTRNSFSTIRSKAFGVFGPGTISRQSKRFTIELEMPNRIIRLFLVSATTVLVLTAAAKLYSATGTAQILAPPFHP